MKKDNQLPAIKLGDKIAQFRASYTQGMESWKRAGEIIVEIVDADPSAYEIIMDQCPGITAQVIAVFERIGRGQILPALAMDNSAGANLLKSLPVSQQERYMAEPVPLVIETERGTDTLLVKVKDMSAAQARQAIIDGRIRTLAEQKAYRAEIRQRELTYATRPAQGETPIWRIRNGRVEFLRGAILSAGELATIITQLTK
jgi:hypothetical protein